MGAKDWIEYAQSKLGLLVAITIALDLTGTSQPELALFQVFHIGVSCLIGFQYAGPRLSAFLILYLWAMAMAMAHDALLWRVFKVAAAPVATCAILGYRSGRKCCGFVLVVFLAVAAQLGLKVMPLFFAEDALPHLGPTPTLLETPALRAQHCAGKAGPPPNLRYLCEGIEPRTWEEAEAKAEESLLSMSMEDRHSLMQGIGWQAFPSALPLPLPAIPKRGYYMGNTPPIPHVGLPALKLHDAGNGFRNNPPPVGKPFTTIMWPSSLAFGATWNPALVEKVAAAIGREYRGKGANVILGPSVQVQRVARNGRNFEYMSGEDPYLGARLAEAYVKGVQKEGVIACLKHYGFNEQETMRSGGNFVVDERTAWELYYPPFEAGVAAGAASVMCSYNRINGTYACSSEELLARDLKKKMGFKGFVMSDWWALHDPPARSAVRGFDQEMPGAGPETYFYREELERLEGKKAGDLKGLLGLSRDRLYKDPAFRILAAAWKMRLDERPSCTPGKDCVEAIESDQRSPENDELAKATATESVILLKNEGGLLPVDPKKVKTIALIGAALSATSLSTSEIGMGGDYYSGGGSGHCYVEKDTFRTPLKGLTLRAQQAGIKVIAVPSNTWEEAVYPVSQADLVIFLAATTAEEGKDRDGLQLDWGADFAIQRLASKPFVVLVQAPGVVLMPWVNQVQAIAMMFLAGEHTSSAWESVVFGDVSPSGKLPIQIPKGLSGVIEPGILPDNYYHEGLFSSYRARNSKETTLFPFGHGLSYTTFTYAEPVQLPKEECKAYACVRTSVKNSGEGGWKGAEVAQAYVEFPPEAEEPKLVLRGFHHTAVLAPGEGEEVVFSFTERDLSIYRHGTWEVQGGIIVHIGASSTDLRYSLALEGTA